MNPGGAQLRSPALLVDRKNLVREIVFEEGLVMPILEQILEGASLGRAAIRFLNDRPNGNFACHRRFATTRWNRPDDQRRVAASPRRTAVHVIKGEALDFFRRR